jgi:hypothetical protein
MVIPREYRKSKANFTSPVASAFVTVSAAGTRGKYANPRFIVGVVERVDLFPIILFSWLDTTTANDWEDLLIPGGTDENAASALIASMLRYRSVSRGDIAFTISFSTETSFASSATTELGLE